VPVERAKGLAEDVPVEPSQPGPSSCRQSVASGVEIGESECPCEAKNEDRADEVNHKDSGTHDEPDRKSLGAGSPFLIHASSLSASGEHLVCVPRINQ
jgi:hypothetical protein